MPIDRATTLRNAEKLLRQGKLDAAIAEYVRVVEDQPRDWNTANVLGDLYVRAGQADKAVGQFVRIADHLKREGFLPKAGAIFKKILKLKPDDEHALMQSAEIAAAQGLLADARALFSTVAERRRQRGDVRGASEIRVRMGTLDPNDFDARAGAARARAEMGDAAGAVSDLIGIADDLVEKGRDPEAAAALLEAVELEPGDAALRERLFRSLLASGQLDRARQHAVTGEALKALAAALESGGRDADALDVLRDAARCDPDDADLRARLARTFVQRGDLDAASEFLTPDTAAGDPALQLGVVEVMLRNGRADDAVVAARALLDARPDSRESVARLAWTAADSSPDAAALLADAAASAAVADGDWAGAAAALHEFVTRLPNHIPSLMRLVEICVDGGLEATMFAAQAQLADAYLAVGNASDARFIAEDLVAREPWERANIERFRKALEILGEPDPDSLIAERLSGQSPFTSTDLSVSDLPGPDDTPAPAEQPAPLPPGATASVPVVSGSPAAAPRPKASSPQDDRHFALGPNAVDLQRLLGELEPRPAREAPAADAVEIDLSVALDTINPARGPIAADDLAGVFQQMRQEASGDRRTSSAEEQLSQGMALQAQGRVDESIVSLKDAARAPRVRFRAASALGRLFRQRSDLPQAIEWLERAAEAPPTSPDEGYALLYELGELLESTGESPRALAVWIELQADAGEYPDVASRIDHLSKVLSRG